MTLAGMLAFDKDAVICDFAETYHVLDVWALPVPLMAALASGLREDSRIRMKMAGYRSLPTQMVLARLSDEVTLFRYGFTKDAQDGKNHPVLCTDYMVPYKEKKKTKGFNSGEDFLAAWVNITKGGE